MILPFLGKFAILSVRMSCIHILAPPSIFTCMRVVADLVSADLGCVGVRDVGISFPS